MKIHGIRGHVLTEQEREYARQLLTWSRGLEERSLRTNYRMLEMIEEGTLTPQEKAR